MSEGEVMPFVAPLQDEDWLRCSRCKLCIRVRDLPADETLCCPKCGEGLEAITPDVARDYQ